MRMKSLLVAIPERIFCWDDSTVSRQHAVFRRVNGQYSVIDAGSLNGTYVNRQRVDQAVLKTAMKS